MRKANQNKAMKPSVHDILYRAGCVLLILTLASACLLCGLLARYLVRGPVSGSGRVAKGGGIELWEHDATLVNGVYELDSDTEVSSNTYEKVIPGVDIPKDPFIRTDLIGSEVDYALYVQITKSSYFPDEVTYTLTDDWTVFDKDKGIYKYTPSLDQFREKDGTIQILKENKLFVSEHYVGDEKSFSLSFVAWIEQTD